MKLSSYSNSYTLANSKASIWTDGEFKMQHWSLTLLCACVLTHPVTPDSATPRPPLPGVHEHPRLPCPSPPRVCSNSQPLSRWCYPRAVEASNSCIKTLHTWSAKHGFFPNWRLVIKLQISLALLKHWREASMYFNKLAIFIFSFNPSPFSFYRCEN